MRTMNFARSDMKQTQEQRAGMALSARTFWMDAVRSAALFGIIGCHAFALGNNAVMELWMAGGKTAFLSQVCFLYAARFGVPFFIMLSGALLLRKRFDTAEQILGFYKTSFLPLFLATEAWVIILHAWYYLSTPGYELWSRGSLKLLARDLLLWKDSLYTHMWYMREILSVYVFVPFLAAFVQRADRRVIAAPVLFLLYCMIGVHTASLGYRLLFQETFYVCPDFIMFVVYMLIGYWIAEKKALRRIPALALCLVPLAAVFLQVLVLLCELGRIGVWEQMLNYSNVFICSGSIAVFALFARGSGECRWRAAARTAEFVSKRSFGAYIVHFPILLWLCGKAPFLLVSSCALINICILTAVSAAASLALVQLLGLVPFLRCWLLHIK